MCRVVDNYGDIGFVYRLARSLAELRGSEVSLRLIVSNLDSFSKMAPGVDSSKAIQKFMGWTVLDWNADETCIAEYKKNPPEVILECFQCGRPDWLENLIFSDELKKDVRILNVEYLTAEDWADDFHLLKSGTRSSHVKKYNFMPGFTEKTGGLVLDADFIKSVSSREQAIQKIHSGLSETCEPEKAFKIVSALKNPSVFCSVIFSYPRNMDGIIEAFGRFQEKRRSENPDFSLCLFVASGLSSKPVMKSIAKEKIPIDFIELPYMTQQTWDALLCASDFNLIRGEDSFSRACLSGNPFLWHAYEQDEEYQLVKVAAFLRRIQSYFTSETCFKNYASLMLLYSRSLEKTPCTEALEVEKEFLDIDFPKSAEEKCELESDLLYALLENSDKIKSFFSDFSQKLLSHGNLAEKLLDFLSCTFTSC